MFCKAIGIDEISWVPECSSKIKIQSCLCHEVAETKFYLFSRDRGLTEPWKEAFCVCLPLEAPSHGMLMGLEDLVSGKRQEDQGRSCRGVELLLLPQVGTMGRGGSDKSRVICFLLWQREIKDVYIRKSVI